ncbi:MAG: FtsH protease activity modulator HflK [Xanthomonadales bacterium]|nr:FtsH protease activity modulator HflK [Xanthomonadales bacterium]
MAWNEPGGSRNPPPGRGGGDDVEAFLNRLKENLGRMFGGGDSGRGGSRKGSGNGGFGLLIVGVLLLWLLFDSVQLIDERENGVVLRFGKAERIMTAGANFKLPRPIERVVVVDVGQIRSSSDQVRMLTKDENIVDIEFNVQYQVTDPELFLFGSRDPETTLKAAAESAVREVMGNTEMDEILTGQRDQLAASSSTKLQESLNHYRTGLSVTQFNIQNARPPQEVKDAFDDAITAREDKQRIENEARAYASKVVPEARGDAARVREEAEGYKAAKIAQAEGDARRFSLLLDEYRKAPEITRRRLYLETMQDVLAANPKVLVDDSNGNNVIYLPGPSAAGSAVRDAVRRGLDTLPAVQQAGPSRNERSSSRASGRSDRQPRGGAR